MISCVAKEVENIIHQLAKRMSYVFVLYGESTEEDRDIYTYVCEAIISTTFNILLCLFTAFILGAIIEGIILLTVFALIRRYAGGYHAKTHLQCIAICNCMVAVGVMLVQNIAWIHTLTSYIGVSSVALIGIFLLAPVEHENKTSGQEYVALKKARSVRMTIIMFSIGLVDYSMLNIGISAMTSLAMIFVLCGLLCGLYSTKRHGICEV